MFNLAFYWDRWLQNVLLCSLGRNTTYDLSIFRHFVSIFKYHNQGKLVTHVTPRQSDCMITLSSTAKSETRPGTVEKSSYQKKRLAEGSIPEEGSSNNSRSGSPSIALAKQTYSTKKIIWTVSSNVTIFSSLVDDQRALQAESCVVHQTSSISLSLTWETGHIKPGTEL